MFAVVASGSGRHLTEAGLFLGILGGLLVAAGAYVVLRGPRHSARAVPRAIERSATLVGFLLVGAGLGVELIVQLGRAFK
jgi:hypothetical protein